MILGKPLQKDDFCGNWQTKSTQIEFFRKKDTVCSTLDTLFACPVIMPVPVTDESFFYETYLKTSDKSKAIYRIIKFHHLNCTKMSGDLRQNARRAGW